MSGHGTLLIRPLPQPAWHPLMQPESKPRVATSASIGKLVYNRNARYWTAVAVNIETQRERSMPLSADAAEQKNRVLVDLLHGCAQGKQPAFQKLYQLASPQLFAVLVRILKRRDLAEEALQDAFLSVWRNASSYTAQKGTPMTWLVSICRYRALDMLRREKREVHMDPADDANQDNDMFNLRDESGDGDLISHAEARALRHCLDELNEGQRNSLKLAYFDGCSHEEIAGALRAPLGTIKSWVRRGLQGLKQCLEAA